MASLAILVFLLFLIVILVGPICYLLCSFKWMPKWMVWIFCLMSGIVGAWWLLLPIGVMRFLGFMPLYFAYIVLNKKGKENAHI
jgi:hypothetical protein